MLDLYCERTSFGLWAEPVNTLSNISFFVSALAAYRLAFRRHQLFSSIKLLIILLIAIGIGSILFHTFATHWANWLDVIPIALFQIVYLWTYVRYVTKLNNLYTLLIIVTFICFIILARQFTHILNRSIVYAPSLLVLLILGLYHYLKGKTGRTSLLIASFLFFLSLFFRTIDQNACLYISIGTHFLWHILNGVLLFLLVRSLLLNSPISLKEST
jgi:hypothetical protein